MLERRFSDAYEIWCQLPDVERCLQLLPRPATGDLTGTVAMVLPGAASGLFGEEIDAHDRVARTGIGPPSPQEADSVGQRFDIALLNKDRYIQLVEARPLPDIRANWIVTDESYKVLGAPELIADRVEFGLAGVETPTSDTAYIPIRSVRWCHARGLRPTLYNGDFYLGDVQYHSDAYDSSVLLRDATGVVNSYFVHDVFFCHAALREWFMEGSITAKGRLCEILKWTGEEFAAALQSRWQGLLSRSR